MPPNVQTTGLKNCENKSKQIAYKRYNITRNDVDYHTSNVLLAFRRFCEEVKITTLVKFRNQSLFVINSICNLSFEPLFAEVKIIKENICKVNVLGY